MSDQNTAAAAATTSDKIFAVGQEVQFQKYAETPPAGQDVFKEGDILRLEKEGNDPSVESYEAVRLSDGMSSTVFFDEVVSYVAPAPTEEGEKAKAKKAKKEKAPKEAKPKAEKPAPEPPAPLVLTESVKALVSDNAEDTIKAAETLSKQIDTNEFTLGGVLAAIRRDNLHTKLLGEDQKPLFSDDKAGFEAYINARLSCGYRKAMYLIGMYEKYSALGVTEQQIAKIGWSKAVLMLGIVTAENKGELLEYAETHSKSEVEAHVKSVRTNAGSGSNSSPRGVRHSFGFNLYNNEGEIVKAAIESAKADLSPEQRKDDKVATNAAFLKIVTEWSQMRAAVAAPAPTGEAPAPAGEAAAPADGAPAAQ